MLPDTRANQHSRACAARRAERYIAIVTKELFALCKGVSLMVDGELDKEGTTLVARLFFCKMKVRVCRAAIREAGLALRVSADGRAKAASARRTTTGTWQRQ